MEEKDLPLADRLVLAGNSNENGTVIKISELRSSKGIVASIVKLVAEVENS